MLLTRQITLCPVFLLQLLFASLAAAASDGDGQLEVVTYGSIMKMEHVESGYRLHSHKLAYGSGSGQQSVTAFPDAGDVNSYWIVKQAHQAPRIASGTVVRCGDTVRFQHLQTGFNLHSHLHRAPMTSDYEVSAYAAVVGDTPDRWNDGDTGDNWILQCEDASSEWKRFARVSFKHVDTGYFLSSSRRNVFSDPIPNQLQVCGTKRKSRDSYWKTNEGIFLSSASS
jgi:dolichyl-phosphate-mannose--protein O-mannosyl transferase